MAWHSNAWSHSAATKLHPIPALDGRYPLRFARIVVKRPGVDNPFEGPTLEGPLGTDTAIVELKSGWESWRVSHLRSTAEVIISQKSGTIQQVAYLTDSAGGALYTHDLLGDLEVVPQARAASVDLLAVLEGDRPIHVPTPSADQERLKHTLSHIDKALAEKEEFLGRMDRIHQEHGIAGAGGMLAALDAAIDERTNTISNIDQISELIAELVVANTPAEDEEEGEGGGALAEARAAKKAAAKAAAVPSAAGGAGAEVGGAKSPWNPHF